MRRQQKRLRAWHRGGDEWCWPRDTPQTTSRRRQRRHPQEAEAAEGFASKTEARERPSPAAAARGWCYPQKEAEEEEGIFPRRQRVEAGEGFREEDRREGCQAW